MNQTGKIIIKDDGIYFEYYELRKSIWHDYESHPWASQIYTERVKEYEASKRLVEIINDLHYPMKDMELMDVEDEIIPFKDGQSCKANVKDNKALIIKIT